GAGSLGIRGIFDLRFSICDWKNAPHSAACGLALLFALMIPAPVSAQSTWNLTTADFRSVQGELNSIDSSGINLNAGGAARSIRWGDILLLERESPPKPATPTTQTAGAGKFILYLAGGDQLRGEPLKIE